MVEQAAERPLAQSGFNAFSFLSGMLRLIGQFALRGSVASVFRHCARAALAMDFPELGFFQLFEVLA